jgi:hypothetical protein
LSLRVTTAPNDIQMLGGGDASVLRMELTVASVSKPLKVKCAIKYEAQGQGAPGTSNASKASNCSGIYTVIVGV